MKQLSLCIFFSIAFLFSKGQVIPADSVSYFVNRTLVVYGTVSQTSFNYNKKKDTSIIKIKSRANSPEFTLLVTPDARAKFGYQPEVVLMSKLIFVRGKIELLKGRYFMQLTGPFDIAFNRAALPVGAEPMAVTAAKVNPTASTVALPPPPVVRVIRDTVYIDRPVVITVPAPVQAEIPKNDSARVVTSITSSADTTPKLELPPVEQIRQTVTGAPKIVQLQNDSSLRSEGEIIRLSAKALQDSIKVDTIKVSQPLIISLDTLQKVESPRINIPRDTASSPTIIPQPAKDSVINDTLIKLVTTADTAIVLSKVDTLRDTFLKDVFPDTITKVTVVPLDSAKQIERSSLANIPSANDTVLTKSQPGPAQPTLNVATNGAPQKRENQAVLKLPPPLPDTGFVRIISRADDPNKLSQWPALKVDPLVGKEVVLQSNVAVKSGPGGQFITSVSLKKGESIKVISCSFGWCKISTINLVAGKIIEGYVKQDKLNIQSDPNPLSKPSASVSSSDALVGSEIVLKANVGLKSGPGGSFTNGTALKQGEKVRVVSCSFDWCKIATVNLVEGKTIEGYVKSDKLR